MLITQSFDFFVQLHLTERCNLQCKHCYQDVLRGQEMSLHEVKEVITEVSEMIEAWEKTYKIKFLPSFTITGGEPFLRSDIFTVLEEIKSKGFDIYILSNGILIDNEKAEKLSSLGIKGVQVSIEGPNGIHEMIRGKGTFSSSIRGIRHLLKAGLKVTLNVTLSDINADSFIEMMGLSSSLGVHRLGFSRLVPSGRGSGLLDNMLKKDKVKELYETIHSSKIKGLDIVTGDPIYSQMLLTNNKETNSIPLGGCAAGVSGLTILQDGTITPCRRLHIPIGNVKTGSLREVWATSEVLQKLRDRKQYSGKCGSCTRWNSCRGCRAIAYAYSCANGKNDFLSEDPQCFIEE